MTLGHRIKIARVERGYTQTKLAELLGVAGPTINKWEHGVTQPGRESLKAITEVLNVSIGWLLFGRDDLTNTEQNNTIPPVGRTGVMLAMVSVEEAARGEIPANPSVVINSIIPISGPACAITIVDSSNAPEHPTGSIWALSFDERPKPGDMVLACHGPDSEPILGSYSVETTATGRVRIVTPKNSRWPAARSDISDLEIVAVMMAEIRPRRI